MNVLRGPEPVQGHRDVSFLSVSGDVCSVSRKSSEKTELSVCCYCVTDTRTTHTV